MHRCYAHRDAVARTPAAPRADRPGRYRTKLSRVAYWYESSIDRQLREARERGEFDNLAGTGKPLPGHGGEYDEDWWVKDWLRREGGGAGVLPATLALRREREDLERQVDRKPSEQAVREHVAAHR